MKIAHLTKCRFFVFNGKILDQSGIGFTLRTGNDSTLQIGARIVLNAPREFCEVVSRFNGMVGCPSDNCRLSVLTLPGANEMAHRISMPAYAFTLLAAFLAAPVFTQTPPVRVPPPVVAPAGSLYARLGGTPAVTAFVAETIDKVSTDPRTNHSFDKVNVQHVKDMLVDQICSLTGGGCVYTGDTMRDVHAGHHISNAEFFDLVEVLRESMRSHGVPLAARNELLEILAPMKRDVVKL